MSIRKEQFKIESLFLIENLLLLVLCNIQDHNINMFGTSQGAGLFSQQNQNKQTAFGGGGGGYNSQGAGLFGPSANQGGGGAGLFGQSQPQGGTGAFGASNTNQSFYGNQPQGGSVFGGAQNQGAGMFGQGQQQNTQGGLFGQQPQNQGQNQGAGLFGAGGNQNQGGIFGQNPQGGNMGGQTQGAGLFGQQNNQSQGQNQGGLFGQAAGGGTGGGAGLFGAVSGAINQSFMGNQNPQPQSAFGTTPFGQTQQNQNQGAGLFGQSAQQGGGNPFGQQQPPSQGGLFNTFANPSQPQNQNQPQTTSMFGGLPQNPTAAFGANNNKLGGTSWGVPTNQPNSGQPMQPIRSKNVKLDAKHLVKCIAAMEQFQGCSKEELRISFIQNGGQQPALNQPQQQGAAGFAKPANPLSTIPSFGGSTNLGGNPGGNTGSTLFGATGGQQNQGTSLFGGQGAKTAFPATTQGGSLFGAPGQNQTPSFGQGGTMFGQQQQQQPQTTAFGMTGSFLGGGQPQQQQGGSLFGTQPQQQQGGSLFGTQPQQQGGSLFGAQPQQQGGNQFGQPQQQQGGSLFGQPQQQQGGSLFGQQQQQQSPFGAPQAGGSLFGASQPGQNQGSAPSLFGGSATTPLQAPPSLYPTAGGTAQPQAGPSPFMPQGPIGYPPSGTPGFAPNPMNIPSTFSQLAAPMFQPNQQLQPMDPAMQLLLPQLLLNAALMQSQGQRLQGQSPGQPATQANPTMDLITNLISNLTVRPNDQQNSISSFANTPMTAPTPFDDFLRDDAYSNSSKWRTMPQDRVSLFSNAEVREFEELDTRSYTDRYHNPRDRQREETFRLRNTYKQSTKKIDPLGEANYKVISRAYKQSHEQAKKKFSPSNEDLPDLGNFTVQPSLDKLKNFTVQQLKKVENVKISNSFGTVEFLEPISLYRLDLTHAIKIAQDNIEIVDAEL
jgi:nuclear pore complex protein Nup98-Nup96